MTLNKYGYHFDNPSSLAFQTYYRETVGNREHFGASVDFFRVFKQKYSLQGIDNGYLARLEGDKTAILQYIDNKRLSELYFGYFADVALKHGDGTTQKNLGSFFAKLVHTFSSDNFCALDNPIKGYFGLRNESFYIAFIVISNAYQEWSMENPLLMSQIRNELNDNKVGRVFSAKMTDLKLLDLIFWYEANEANRV